MYALHKPVKADLSPSLTTIQLGVANPIAKTNEDRVSVTVHAIVIGVEWAITA